MRVSVYYPEEERFQLVELDTDPSAAPSTAGSFSSDPLTSISEPPKHNSDSEPQLTQPREPCRGTQTLIPPPQPFQPRPSFILVIGGLGYIGSHTALELLRQGRNVIIVDDLSNSYPSVLDNITTLLDLHHMYEPGTTAKPLLHFHRLDYRSRDMTLLFESYSDLVMTINASGRQSIEYRSRITGVVHLATQQYSYRTFSFHNGNRDITRLLRRLERFEIRSLVFGGFQDVAALSNMSQATTAWRICVVRCHSQVIGCDGSGLLGGCPRGAGEVTDALFAQLSIEKPAVDLWHVLHVSRVHVRALESEHVGVRVVDLEIQGVECDTVATQRAGGTDRPLDTVDKTGGGDSEFYVTRKVPRKGMAWRALELWKFVRW